MKLLIVEDNHSLVVNLFEYFEARGHVLDAAPDGVIGLHLALANHYDAIVLDWVMPRLDGVEFIKLLQAARPTNAPIIMLTARNELDDKLTGFHAGADDYLTKPFAIPELEIRLEKLVNRALPARLHVLEIEDLRFDLDTLKATRGGVTIRLYPASRKILEVLMRASPAVVSREQLEQVLWGDAAGDVGRLRSHLYDLRTAVDGPFDRKLIHTKALAGYWIGAPDDD